MTDQIGATRSGNVDMGSYEFGGVVLSVKKNVIGNVKLFPTISNGLIHVSDNKTYQLYVYDVLGQIIKSGIIRGEIDISNHPKGLYFVKLRSDNFEHTFKVLLN